MGLGFTFHLPVIGLSHGEDKVTCKILKTGKEALAGTHKILFYKWLDESKIQIHWQNAEGLILFKKGDHTTIMNYRPVNLLLSHMFKLLLKVITNRFMSNVDMYQTVEQAGCKQGYTTPDNIQSVKILIEKTHDYNVSLYRSFCEFYKSLGLFWRRWMANEYI